MILIILCPKMGFSLSEQERMSALRASGMRPCEIARHMGHPYEPVYKWLKRHSGLSTRIHVVYNKCWTDELVEWIACYREAGLTFREIGEKMGMSRNSVIGAWHRFLGLAAPQIEAPTTPQLGDLGVNDCRWPHGHPGEAGFGFCGVRSVPGRPYCAEHVAVAYWRVDVAASKEGAD